MIFTYRIRCRSRNRRHGWVRERTRRTYRRSTVRDTVFKCSMDSSDIGGLGKLSFAQKYYHLGREINDLVTENRCFKWPPRVWPKINNGILCVITWSIHLSNRQETGFNFWRIQVNRTRSLEDSLVDVLGRNCGKTRSYTKISYIWLKYRILSDKMRYVSIRCGILW